MENTTNCPVCKTALTFVKGHQADPEEGMTAYCGNNNCRAQEVVGHGKNAKEAYNIVLQKFQHVIDKQ